MGRRTTPELQSGVWDRQGCLGRLGGGGPRPPITAAAQLKFIAPGYTGKLGWGGRSPPPTRMGVVGEMFGTCNTSIRGVYARGGAPRSPGTQADTARDREIRSRKQLDGAEPAHPPPTTQGFGDSLTTLSDITPSQIGDFRQFFQVMVGHIRIGGYCGRRKLSLALVSVEQAGGKTWGWV